MIKKDSALLEAEGVFDWPWYLMKNAKRRCCIAHEKNYKLTAAHSGFTYQQIYGWVQRYQKAGLEGLVSGHQSGRVFINGSVEEQAPSSWKMNGWRI